MKKAESFLYDIYINLTHHHKTLTQTAFFILEIPNNLYGIARGIHVI